MCLFSVTMDNHIRIFLLQVLIKFLASTVNPSDINTIQGMYAIKPSLPCLLGNEGVAQVVEIHSDDTE